MEAKDNPHSQPLSPSARLEIEGKLEASQIQLALLEQGRRSVLEFVDKMEQLVQFQDKIDIPSDIDQIWRVFQGDVRNAIAAEACALFLVDESTHEFVLRGTTPEEQGPVCQREIEFQIECGMFSWVINRREPAIVPSVVFKNGRSLVMLPLSTAKRTLGVAMVLTPIKESHVTRECLKLLKVLSKQCSLVLENTVLYDRLKKEHESLQNTRLKLHQSEKLAAMGRLTMGAFHEILNPLNIISGHIQFALMDDSLGPRIQKYLTIMQGQSERIAGIVKSLLQFSQFSKPKVERVDIHRIIDRAVEFARTGVDVVKIQIRKIFEKHQPVVMGEAEQICQVVAIFLANAIDAMPEGGLITISTRMRCDKTLSKGSPNRVEIEFRDTGRGIAPGDIGKIFEPFFTTKEIGTGAGLGLSLAYGIITGHGGAVRVQSELNKGATFTIDLPAGGDPEPDQGLSSEGKPDGITAAGEGFA